MLQMDIKMPYSYYRYRNNDFIYIPISEFIHCLVLPIERIPLFR